MEGDEATRRRADYESSDDEDCMFNPDMFVNRKCALPSNTDVKFSLIGN
jgi:hypothetical protein